MLEINRAGNAYFALTWMITRTTSPLVLPYEVLSPSFSPEILAIAALAMSLEKIFVFLIFPVKCDFDAQVSFSDYF